jgi:hypothetical protein
MSYGAGVGLTVGLNKRTRHNIQLTTTTRNLKQECQWKQQTGHASVAA